MCMTHGRGSTRGKTRKIERTTWETLANVGFRIKMYLYRNNMRDRGLDVLYVAESGVTCERL